MTRVAPLFLAAALFTVAAPACQKSSSQAQGPCASGTQLRGKAPPDGTAQWCVKEGGSTKHGKWTEWYASGKLKSEGQYVDGKMDGLWVSYHDGGVKKEEGKYIAGLKDGLWASWHEDGTKKRESQHKAGSWEVTWTAFRTDGKKWAEGLLVGAQENGPYSEWHPNGKLAAKGSYKSGQKNNDWEYCDSAGEPSENPQGDFAEPQQ
jgi:antitoxin component YwqK of YwqJK toxin-antitoxin module